MASTSATIFILALAVSSSIIDCNVSAASLNLKDPCAGVNCNAYMCVVVYYTPGKYLPKCIPNPCATTHCSVGYECRVIEDVAGDFLPACFKKT